MGVGCGPQPVMLGSGYVLRSNFQWCFKGPHAVPGNKLGSVSCMQGNHFTFYTSSPALRTSVLTNVLSSAIQSTHMGFSFMMKTETLPGRLLAVSENITYDNVHEYS